MAFLLTVAADRFSAVKSAPCPIGSSANRRVASEAGMPASDHVDAFQGAGAIDGDAGEGGRRG